MIIEQKQVLIHQLGVSCKSWASGIWDKCKTVVWKYKNNKIQSETSVMSLVFKRLLRAL